ncbi:hypothetical protein C8R48DRAFT_463353 [Suillus tomentosus]|nr:hypothetical protein C8R48DRAFT_463353 [Suillus tomentosus]
MYEQLHSIILGCVRCGAFVSMVALDVRSRALNAVAIFLVAVRLLDRPLWVVWVGTAQTIARSAHYFPDGCIYSDYATTSRISCEVTVAEAAAFIIFFAFVYYDTNVSYAIIQATRGKGIWMSSIVGSK